MLCERWGCDEGNESNELTQAAGHGGQAQVRPPSTGTSAAGMKQAEQTQVRGLALPLHLELAERQRSDGLDALRLGLG